mgnify:CR=1 FL=1
MAASGTPRAFLRARVGLRARPRNRGTGAGHAGRRGRGGDRDARVDLYIHVLVNKDIDFLAGLKTESFSYGRRDSYCAFARNGGSILHVIQNRRRITLCQFLSGMCGIHLQHFQPYFLIPNSRSSTKAKSSSFRIASSCEGRPSTLRTKLVSEMVFRPFSVMIEQILPLVKCESGEYC